MPDATAAPQVKGLDLDALKETLEAVRADPARGRVAWRVSTEWKGQARTESTVESCTVGGEIIPRNFTVVADEPCALLGSDSAPSPHELLMAAVSSCMMVAYVAQAAVRGIHLDDCRIEIEGEFDLRGLLGIDETVPPGYRRLCYTVWLEGDGTRDQYEDIHQAVMSSSPNYFNLAQPVQMCGRLA